MKNHTLAGKLLLEDPEKEVMRIAAEIAYSHHEKWNGSGYPNGLSGLNIPLYGRIVGLADVFDALSFDRYYKKAWELEDVLEFIKSERGKHFEPKLVDTFFDSLEHILAVTEKYKNEM